MSKKTISLSLETYKCEPCSLRQGTPVRELIRMVPLGVVVEGKLVGDEWYCCPICYEAKFHVRTRKSKELIAQEAAQKKVGKSRAPLQLVAG